MAKGKTDGNGKRNIYEVARVTGYSIATVSRVLNNKVKVAPGTRRAVLDAMRRLNYVPRLRVARQTALGVLIEYRGAVMTNYAAGVINGISRQLDNADARLSIFSLFARDVAAAGVLHYLRDNELDGVIVLMSGDHSDYIERLAAERFPYVVINNRYDRRINYLEVDSFRGAVLATEHLLDLGHRRIALVNGSLQQENFRERLRGYRDALARRRVRFDPKLVPGETGDVNHLDLGRAKMLRLAGSGADFTAAFCASDDIAFGALRALKEIGRKVPRDVSIVGFDDYPISSYIEPALTTVRQPLEELGAEAARELLHVIGTRRAAKTPEEFQVQEKRPIQRTFAPELVVRESTAKPRS